MNSFNQLGLLVCLGLCCFVWFCWFCWCLFEFCCCWRVAFILSGPQTLPKVEQIDPIMLYSLCQGVFILPTPFSAGKLSCKVLVTPYQALSQGDYMAVTWYIPLMHSTAWVLWHKCSFSWDVRQSCFSESLMIMSKVLVISAFWGSILFLTEPELFCFIM